MNESFCPCFHCLSLGFSAVSLACHYVSLNKASSVSHLAGVGVEEFLSSMTPC